MLQVLWGAVLRSEFTVHSRQWRDADFGRLWTGLLCSGRSGAGGSSWAAPRVGLSAPVGSPHEQRSCVQGVVEMLFELILCFLPITEGSKAPGLN